MLKLRGVSLKICLALPIPLEWRICLVRSLIRLPISPCIPVPAFSALHIPSFSLIAFLSLPKLLPTLGGQELEVLHAARVLILLSL